MSNLRRSGDPALRNSAKYTRNFGRSVALGGEAQADFLGVAESRPKRLFNKNTGLCEAVKRRIGTDTCPVLEGYGEGLATSVAKL